MGLFSDFFKKAIQGNEEKEEDLPFRRKDYLLTIAERKFFEVLKQITEANDWLLFSKVRLEDLLWIPRYTPRILKWRGYIRSRHIDFVICNKEDIRPLCAIELDDSSHNSFKAQEADDLKNAILDAAGLPLLRIPVRSFYNAREIANMISEILS